MQNGFYMATGAMVTQFNKLNVVSNNLANINTTGFKKDGVVIGDFERIFQEKRDNLPLKNHTKEGAKFLNRSINRVPQVVEGYTEFIPGVVKHTGNPLDVALKKGDTFFLVDTPNGVRLTQDGSFTTNSNGELVTKEGYHILPSDFFINSNDKITLPINSSVHIDKDGTIYANSKEVAKLFIAQPKNVKKLQKEGDKLFTIKDLENSIIDASSRDNLQQGFLQMSNVNAVKEMVSLIEVNRMVEMYQKIMTVHMDDLNRDAITKLGSIKV